MKIDQAFQILRSKFKTDGKCAKFVGFTPEHFESMRNGRVHIPKRTADLIILKAQEVRDNATP